MPSQTILRRATAAATGTALAAAGLVLAPSAALAAPDGSGVVINEVYGGGGNSGAAFQNDFVELYNPTGTAIDLGGLTIDYKSAGGGSGGTVALEGTIDAQGYFLVQLAAGNGNGQPLPAADQVAASPNLSGSTGRVYLHEGTGQYAPTTGDLAGADGLVDMIGWGGGAVAFEGAPAAGTANATSAQRAEAGVDTDDNAADFVVAAPTPQASGTAPEEPEEPEEPTEPGEPISVAEANQAAAGTELTVEGVVTADYREGGFNGFTIQDPAGDPADGVSDAIFVYNPSAAVTPAVGDSVRITGDRGEYNGLRQVYGDLVEITDADLGEVVPLTSWEAVATEEGKQAHMSELVLFEDAFTVTDNYDANFYGSFSLVQGDEPVPQLTAYIDPHDEAAIAAQKAADAARTITLDDGRSTNFNSQKDVPFSYLTPDNPVRVGAAVEFRAPFVLDYRFDAWSLQPTTPIEGTGTEHVAFSDERTPNASPESVLGDISIANLNVLNYFPTTAEEYVELGLGSCTYYTDREGNRIGTDRCEPDGPRGAATAESFARQQIKIVKAITALDASILSLQEMENSAKFGKDRDFAVANLVDALNERAGEEVWAYAESPQELPADEDVIRNAFIYQVDEVEPVGPSRILLDDPAFVNAREPLFQAFKPAGAADDAAFLVSANHLKSKGCSGATGENAALDEQSCYNADRVEQAQALLDATAEVQEATGIDAVFHTGDFNAYAMEDPATLITGAGYTNLNYALNGGEATYVYGGMSGSLDHVFANAQALELVADADVWQINGQEQVGFEYSRYNYNATLLYDESVFRTSDHNPIVIGLDAPDAAPTDETAPTVTVKEGEEFTVGSVEDGYELVSFTLFDEGGIDRVVLNGTVTDLVDDRWSDLDFVKPGAFGGRLGANTLEVFDVAGNLTTVEFTLVTAGEPGAPAWERGEVYTAGDEVTYEGAEYEAQWWTTEVPGSTPWGSWMEIGETSACESGEVGAWTESRVYTAGDEVVRDGEVFEARWWTRNQEPGGQWGPWEHVGTC